MSKLKVSQPKSYFLDGTEFVPPPLSANFPKSNFLLSQTIAGMCAKSSIKRLLFVTLTFAAKQRSTRQAHRRMNSLLNKVRPRYGNYLWVLQPHESGVIHYHLLIPVTFCAHHGTNLDPWRHHKDFDDDARIAAMSPRLLAEWAWWTTKAPRFGFGRVEVAPIYSNAAAIQKYLTRHEWRYGHWPFVETKSFHYWSCTKGLKAGNMQFAWHSPGATRYRQELEEYARERGVERYEDLKIKLGSDWSFWFRMQRESCRS